MIPTLGYPSRTEAVAVLKAQGLDVQEIGQRLNLTPSVVSALASSAARRKIQVALGRRGDVLKKGRAIVVCEEVLQLLEPDAIKRRITVNELVRRIVECVADDKLVQAILDD